MKMWFVFIKFCSNGRVWVTAVLQGGVACIRPLPHIRGTVRCRHDIKLPEDCTDSLRRAAQTSLARRSSLKIWLIWWFLTLNINYIACVLSGLVSYVTAWPATVNPHLGPLQISLGRMIMDILKWIALFCLVLFAFSCGMNQLLWYYAKMERAQCDLTHTKALQRVTNSIVLFLGSMCPSRVSPVAFSQCISLLLYWCDGCPGEAHRLPGVEEVLQPLRDQSVALLGRLWSRQPHRFRTDRN